MFTEKLNFYFYLRASKAKKSGLVSIYERLKGSGRRYDFSTRLFVDPQDWNNDIKRLDPRCEDADQINSELQDIIERIKNIVNKLNSLNKAFSLEELALRVKGEYKEIFVQAEILRGKVILFYRLIGNLICQVKDLMVIIE